MTRHSPQRLAAGLAAVALCASSWTSLPAHAAPSTPTTPTAPATPEAAPAPVSTTDRSHQLAPASGTVQVDGHAFQLVAQLGDTSASFTMVGLTWKSISGPALIQVRARTATGWQPWRELEAEPDGASASERARGGTDPQYLGNSVGVEARILAPAGAKVTVDDARIALIDTRALAQDTTVSERTRSRMASAAVANPLTNTPAQPPVITRAQWGADANLLSYNGRGCVTPTIDTTIKAAAVHHTEGTNDYTAAQSASIVRGIYAFHVRDRGWCDIGYNFLVDKYGQVFEGRHGGITNVVHGAHATSWNTDTVGISVMMNSMVAQPTPAAMDALSSVIAWKLAGNYRDPLSTLTLAGTRINRIFRHGDVMQTDCPGTNITAYMPTLRKQVATKMGDWHTPIYNAWQAQGGESGSLGSPHVLERPWNGGRTTTFTGGGIFQTPGGQTWWMGRTANSRYLSTDAFGVLGWPTGNQVAGAQSGQLTVPFQKGTLWASPATGTHLTTSAVDAWLAAHPQDRARLGYPTGEAGGTPTEGSQNFASGRLVWSGGTTSAVYTSGKQGDLDGDGRADVLTVASNGQVTWYPTQPDGRSGAARSGSLLEGAPFTWVSQTPDVNKDGFTELLARRGDGSLWAWDGQGNGQFTNPRQVGRGWNGMRQVNVVPDMTGDGLPEIIAISADQQLYRYSLGRTGSVVSTRRIGQNWGAIVHMTSVGDFRGAGVTDVLGVTADGLLIDYYGSPSGELVGSRQVGRGWNGYVRMHSIGDANGDGRWDLVGNRASGPLNLYVNKQGSWGTAVAMLPEVQGLGTIA